MSQVKEAVNSTAVEISQNKNDYRELLPAGTTTAKAIVMFNLDKKAFSYAELLPAELSVERFITTCKVAIAKNPKLLEANRLTLYLAIDQACKDGLLLDGKEAALAIFGNEVQYMPMIAGIYKLGSNTGLLTTPISEVIYQNDLFEHWTINGAVHLKHAPAPLGSNRGDAIGVYATCQIIKTGECVAEVIDKQQVEAIKSCSKMQNALVWNKFWQEGWRKSVSRRMFKRLPRSSNKEWERFESAMTRGDDDYDFDNQPESGVTATGMQAEDVTPNKPKQTKAAAAVAAATPNPELEAKPELDAEENFEEIVETNQGLDGDIF